MRANIWLGCLCLKKNVGQKTKSCRGSNSFGLGLWTRRDFKRRDQGHLDLKVITTIFHIVYRPQMQVLTFIIQLSHMCTEKYQVNLTDSFPTLAT